MEDINDVSWQDAYSYKGIIKNDVYSVCYKSMEDLLADGFTLTEIYSAIFKAAELARFRVELKNTEYDEES